MKINKRIMAAAAVSFLFAGQAVADTNVTISNWISPKHPVIVGGYQPLIEKMEGAGFSVKSFEGGALLGAKPALPGIGDGIANMGMLAMTYFPAEFPHAQLVADMGLSTPNSLTAMAAATEFNLLHCTACLDEYKKANVIYMGTYSTSPYRIISKMPIRSTADLAGKKMRVPGSLWSRWADAVGGIQVNMPSSEMFEGLDKGALDIAIQAPGALRSYALWDTAEYITTLNLGTYHSLSLMTMNRDFWADLSEEQRSFIVGEAARAGVDTTLQYEQTDKEVISELEEHKVELIEPSDEMKKDKADFATGDVAAIIENAKTKHGIADAEVKVAKLNELIAKWSGIVEETKGDRDAFIARMNADIYSKLPEGYGLN